MIVGSICAFLKPIFLQRCFDVQGEISEALAPIHADAVQYPLHRVILKSSPPSASPGCHFGEYYVVA